ncbi:phosphatidate cytidylyltransferase [Rhizosaccharibacter radicis]|uniref:Phosphatidate cytidylyltransferase n=1 Tax=Rhizosaccharibacter radicis TaxID=2782605 RepID=A0ABT1VVA9_9PROT|nr:phosphatidate cytidylyltransferase [Acetobacteraceae bacterium KSS12]
MSDPAPGDGASVVGGMSPDIAARDIARPGIVAPGAVPVGAAPVGTAPPGGTSPGGTVWRDLRVRVLSALVLAPVGIACILMGGPLFALLVLAGMVGIGVEWRDLLRHPPRSLRGLVFLCWPAIAAIAGLTGRWPGALLILAASLVLGVSTAIGVAATGLAGLSLLWLRFMTGSGVADVLFVLLVVWASDSFAYLAGRLIGGPKLAPSISPGKTWSGSVGGLLAGILVGGIVAGCAASPGASLLPALGRGLAAGLLLSVVSQAGDLAESALKRRCGVKDSGRLIPGHGGLLDRFDGLLAAAPVAALLSLWAPAGGGFWFAGASGGLPAIHAAPHWVSAHLSFLLPPEDRP